MKADLIIHNAHAFTADPSQPWAEAAALAGNRILAVGDNQQIRELEGPGTRTIDGQGRSLLPGFIDSHFHLLWGSMELADAQLGGVQNLDALRSSLEIYRSKYPDRSWIVGQGLPYLQLPGRDPLNRSDLDTMIPNRPAALSSYDGHTVWANTRALELAGILNGGSAGPGSTIVMGSDGLASGELRERDAFRKVLDLIPIPDEAEKRRLLQSGLHQAAELGITSIHNMDGDLNQLGRYMALEDLGELSLRVYVPYSIRPHTVEKDLEEATEMALANPTGLARGGAVKFFIDGVIESYTALVLEEYADAPGVLGDSLYSADHFNRMGAEADRLGFQIFTHAIGDAAVRRTLDGYEEAARRNGRRDSRHRVEHLELIDPNDLPRFAQLGVIAAMQPEHAPLQPSGQDIWPKRVGPGRWDRSFAWRRVRQAGAILTFGSDWPVVTQSPFQGIHAALNRRPWGPGLLDQRQTLEETLYSYTSLGAYAEFKEAEKGKLAGGYLADLVLLSEDIFATAPGRLKEVRPVLTICDGRVVFERDT